jgi:hypothetical protein
MSLSLLAMTVSVISESLAPSPIVLLSRTSLLKGDFTASILLARIRCIRVSCMLTTSHPAPAIISLNQSRAI